MSVTGVREGPRPPVAVQLYSLRDEAAADFAGVLARVGSLGYVGVELAGLHGLAPDAVRAAADDAGLRLASAHVGWSDRDGFAAELDTYRGMGVDLAVVPFFAPDAFVDLDAIARVVETLDVARELAAEREMTLGYHNHWWELERVIDGRPALLHLFDRVAPGVVAEVDVYWARVGGVDPAALLAELGDRVAVLHVKDGPADGPQSAMVAVGDGVIDVASVVAAAPTARWHVVELDRCETDMFEAVARSREFLVDRQLSTGRS